MMYYPCYGKLTDEQIAAFARLMEVAELYDLTFGLALNGDLDHFFAANEIEKPENVKEIFAEIERIRLTLHGFFPHEIVRCARELTEASGFKVEWRGEEDNDVDKNAAGRTGEP